MVRIVAWLAFSCAVCLVSARCGAQGKPSDLLTAAQDAVAADDYPTAQQLLAKAVAAAKGDPTVQADIADTRREIGSLQKEFAKLAKAREAFKASPNDADANEALGRFYAFSKRDLDRGLPMLARCGNEALKTVALREAERPSDVESQVELGDLWREIAETDRESAAVARATLRARHWYLLAAEILTDDAERKPIFDRLDKLRLYPTKIVVVNTHNGRHSDRGALLVDVKLLLDGKVVHTRRTPMPWKPREIFPVTIRVPRMQADAVQVDVLKWPGVGGALAEVEVYQQEVNLARDSFAEASATGEAPFTPDRVTDGDYGGEFEQGGLWDLPDNQAGWVRVALDRP